MMNTKDLSPCPLCGFELELYLHDDTQSKFCNGSPCWGGGASCEQCGVSFCVGNFGGGISVDQAEKYITEVLNERPK